MRSLPLAVTTLFLFFFSIWSPCWGQGQSRTSNEILILHSYDYNNTWTNQLHQGILSVLNTKTSDHWSIHVIYMDAKRKSGPQYLESLVKMLGEHYLNNSFKLIIVTDNDAFHLIRLNRQRLFPDTPVVFGGVQNYRSEWLAGQGNFTGVVEIHPYRDTIEEALKLFPQTKELVIVNDDTNAGKDHLEMLDREIFPLYRDRLKFNILSLGSMSMEELLLTVAKLPPDSVILLLQHFLDKLGNYYTHTEGVRLVSSVAASPIFVVTDSRVVNDVVGGKVVDGIAHGQLMGEMAQRILRGELADNVPIINSGPTKYLFNYNGLRRWGISLSQLPPGSEILNKPQNFYQKNRQLFIIFSVISMVLLIVLAFLGVNNYRRILAEKELRLSRDFLVKIIDSISDPIFVKDEHHHYVLVNKAECQLLNATRENIIGKSDRDFLSSEEVKGFYKTDSEVLDDNDGDSINEENITIAGESKTVITKKGLYRDPEGKKFVVGTITDITQRKQMEEGLRESLARFEAIIEQTPMVAIQGLDRLGIIQHWNTTSSRFYGREFSEVVGRPIQDILLDPSDRLEFSRIIEQVWDQGRATEPREWPVRKADGSIVWVLSVVFPLTRGGKTEEIFCMDIDITVRKKIEMALAISEEKYRNLFETMADGVVYQNSEGKIISINPAAEKLLGITQEQIKGLKSIDPRWQCIHEDGSPFPGDNHPAMVALQTGKVAQRVMGIYHPLEQRYRWAVVTATPRIYPGETGPYEVFATIADITAIKDAEKAIKESENKFRSLFNNMVEGVALHRVLYDMAGTPVNYIILDVNSQYEKILGLKRAEVLRRPGHEVYHTPIPPYLEEFSKVAETGTPIYFEIYFAPMEKHFAISISTWEKGYFATIFSDITERKKTEIERERLMTELERKNKELERIIYVASHDLRTPLVNMQGFTQRLEKYYQEFSDLAQSVQNSDSVAREEISHIKERVSTAFNFIKASVTKMDNLINGLLRLSRTGRAEIRAEKLNINQMLGSITASMTFQIQRANATIEVEELPPCFGDAAQVNQVFSNLIDNAVKYRDMTRTLHIKISGKIDNQLAIYCVADNGLGIDHRHKDRVWDIFYRLNPTGPIGGEGLGLTVVRQIVDRHGGRVWLDCEISKGCQFFVALPLERTTLMALGMKEYGRHE
ncbi:MAG: PAS domain S-box protein [Pseudomonadota bacterium]